MSHCKLYFTVFIFIFLFTTVKAQTQKTDTISTYSIQPKTLNFNFEAIYDTTGAATGLHVSYQLPNQPSTNHPLVLYLDNMEPTTRNQDTVRNLSAYDQAGKLSFLKKRIADGRILYQTSRNVSGSVQVAYDISAANALGRHGPHRDMQQSGGGIVGSFISFLLLPDLDEKFSFSINWKVKKREQAISTFGSGDIKAGSEIHREEIMNAQFVMGKLFTYPNKNAKTGFSIAGLGLSPEQIGNSISKYEKTYQYMLKELHGSPKSAFRFFFRSFKSDPLMSGTAVKLNDCGSFVLYIPAGGNLKNIDVYNLVAHEMIHVFIQDAETDWYTEGIADYLSAILPYRAGLTTKADYIALINHAAAAYYTNSIRLASERDYNDHLKWTTTNSWQLAYSRGMLYFANLDSKLDRLPGAHPTVISLVMDMNKAGEKGTASWEKLLREKVGEWAINDYKLMLSGQLLIPEQDAFGKDLVVTKIKTGIFDLGHNGSRGSGEGQIIKKLNPESNAAKAGLREGDVITKDIDLSVIYNEYDKPITVSVNRAGKTLSITYQPHGKTVEGYVWSAK